MMHDGLSDRFGMLLTEEGGHYVVTVLAGIDWQLSADDCGTSGHQISQADKFVADCAGWNLAGPARDKRLTMPSIPDVGLDAAKPAIRAMPMRFRAAGTRPRRRTPAASTFRAGATAAGHPASPVTGSSRIPLHPMTSSTSTPTGLPVSPAMCRDLPAVDTPPRCGGTGPRPAASTRTANR